MTLRERVVAIEERLVHERFAAYYRDLTRRRLGRVYAGIANDAIAMMPADRGVVVDVGCGPLNLLGELAARGACRQLVGVDPSVVLLQAGSVQGVYRVAGLAEAIPLADGCADLVISTGSIHHWSAPRQGARELFRILKPAGRLLLCDQLASVRPDKWIRAWRQGFVGMGLSALPTAEIVRAVEMAGFKDVFVAEEGALLALRAIKPQARPGGTVR